MDTPKYETFDLRLSPLGGGRASVVLFGSPAGGGTGHGFDIPVFSPELLRGLHLDPQGPGEAGRGAGPLSGEGSRWSEAECAREIGRVLFEALLGGRLAELFRTSRQLAGDRGTRLRLKLRLPEDAPDLAQLPWEYLYDPAERDFLAIRPETSLVRCMEGAQPGPSPLRVLQPLRILVVVATPKEYPPLDSEREVHQLQEAVQKLGGAVRLEILAQPGLAALRARLRQGGVHVLHFVGHGEVGPNGEGCLVLVGPAGALERARTGPLRALLQEAHDLRLVVLNCCQGGVTSPVDPQTGLAQALLRAGVPAVVAMQSPVSDEAAVTFASNFYRGLAASGSVEQGVMEARRALYLDDGNDAEWGAPVLFLRVEEGQLFGTPRRWPRLVAGAAAAGVLGLAVWFIARLDLPPPGPPPPLRPLLPSSERCPSPGGLSFAFIEPGEFSMGEGRDKRPVRISNALCMSRYEVTQGEWDDVMGDGSQRLLTDSSRLPAQFKSPQKVDEWVRRFGGKHTAVRCRLPTDAEWEHSARAGSATRNFFGDDDRDLPRFANCEGWADRYGDEPAPVGAFEPNRWGLFDMQGNLSEWVAVDASPKFLLSGTVVDPKGSVSRPKRVRRGGSYKTDCAVATRHEGEPDRRRKEAGFRIVCEPLPQKR